MPKVSNSKLAAKCRATWQLMWGQKTSVQHSTECNEKAANLMPSHHHTSISYRHLVNLISGSKVASGVCILLSCCAGSWAGSC